MYSMSESWLIAAVISLATVAMIVFVARSCRHDCEICCRARAEREGRLGLAGLRAARVRHCMRD